MKQNANTVPEQAMDATQLHIANVEHLVEIP